jgi:hypothetical protein
MEKEDLEKTANLALVVCSLRCDRVRERNNNSLWLVVAFDTVPNRFKICKH